MSLILAVEPDRRRASQLQSLARTHLDAEIIVGASVTQVFETLGDRMPDVVLSAPLLPPAEEAALTDYLRLIGPAGTHVPLLTIPLLTAPPVAEPGLLSAFRRKNAPAVAPGEGCDPAMFAEQIRDYLRRATPPPAVTPLPSAAPAATPPPSVVAEPTEDIDLSGFLDEDVLPEVVVLEPELVAEPIVPSVPELVLEARPEPEPEPEPGPEPEWQPEPAPEWRPEPSTEAAPPPMPAMLVPVAAPVAPAPMAMPMASPGGAPPGNPHPGGTVQQLIAIPTADGTHVQAAVNVAVAVSVQVAAAVNVTTAAPKRAAKPKPVQDEWGFFDPGQCGFPALLARLDEIAAKDET